MSDEAKLEIAFAYMDAAKNRAIMKANERKACNWLAVLPVACYQFALPQVEFPDASAL